jgi:hypothetical protein
VPAAAQEQDGEHGKRPASESVKLVYPDRSDPQSRLDMSAHAANANAPCTLQHPQRDGSTSALRLIPIARDGDDVASSAREP